MKIEEFDNSVVRPALLSDSEVGLRCLTCWRKCIIPSRQLGFCHTRLNQDGKLYTLVYGNVSSLSNNPIEKKPIFHFEPGTRALTIGSWGCNATCGFCQNYDISKTPPNPRISKYLSPEDFVTKALAFGSAGTSVSLNEAATLMLEWNVDMFRIAHKSGLYNTIVTNGYMSHEALDLLIKAGLDAANVDIKGCREGVKRECGIDVEHVWNNVKEMKGRGIHVEIATLIVPGLSDEMACLEKIATRMHDEIGPKTPWHVNRYHPAYKYNEPPTDLDILLSTKMMAQEIGLKFVYIGNVWGAKGLENTICPNCGEISYERYAMRSRNTNANESGQCNTCGEDLSIITCVKNN